MSATSGRLRGTLLAVGITLGAATFLAPSASAAAPVTTLGFAPQKGLASTPMYLVVPQPCPAAATNVSASAFGKGMPATGQTVINNSTSGISHKFPFILPLQDTFTGFAADNGALLSGPYKILFRCSNRLRTTIYSTFSGTITFSDATHFTAPAPSRAVVAAIAASQNPTPATGANPTAAPSAGGASGQAKGSTGATGTSPGAGSSSAPNSAASGGAAAGSQAPGAATGANPTNASNPSNSKQDSGSSWQPWLVGGALALILLAIVLGIRERTVARRREAARLAKRKSAKSEPIDLTDSDGDPADPADPHESTGKKPSVTASPSSNSSKGPRA